MPEAKIDTEQSLIGLVIEGDRTAFGRLVRPHSRRLLTLAGRMLGSYSEAEDTVQDALASVWLARARLDPTRIIIPFLTTIVLNKCRDRLRRRKVAGLIGIALSIDDLSLPDEGPDPETTAVSRDSLRRLREEIERLPIRLREALVLVAIDGRSQAEASELLGVSEKTIETRVYRARNKLRKKFDKL